MSHKMMMRAFGIVLGSSCIMMAGAQDTHYVAQAGQTPAKPYTSWDRAASNIQDAVDEAVSGDTVLVSNGVYNAGGTAYERVNINKMITLLAVSTNPYDTVINGGGDHRCLDVSAGGSAALIGGFLMTNGQIQAHGAGINYWGTAPLVVSNCIIEGNTAIAPGNVGGARSASLHALILKNCIIRGNAAGGYAGGAYQCVLTNNCQVLNNSSTGSYGGGLVDCMMDGGTIAGNRAKSSGGGVVRGCLRGVLVSNNAAFGNTANDGGGGLYNASAFGCVIAGNSASNGFGGGVFEQSLVSDCTVTGNAASWGGAAAKNVTFLHCTVSGNTAIGNGIGGGIFDGGSASNCFLSGNHAYYGGAASHGVMLTDCTIADNTAYRCAGISYHKVGLAAGKACIATRCAIVSNTATSFGGGAFGGCLTNCLIAKNQAVDGPGAYISTMVNCTVVGNESSGAYAGIYGGLLTNCIVWGNRKSGGEIFNYEGSPVFSSSCTWPLPTGLSDGGNNKSADPKFVDAVAGNYRLKGSSPCINTGNNLDWTESSLDLDLKPRLRYGKVDMGAYERVFNGTVIGVH
ncbi:MAG: hypothetical protein PHR35_17705 [Kiritimatiellae bacterium]|nr:hypothetical protein [Kiritimatiellia bacterium]